jgi:hypothetical protein
MILPKLRSPRQHVVGIVEPAQVHRGDLSWRLACDQRGERWSVGAQCLLENARTMASASGAELRHQTPTAVDYRYILRGSKGPFEAPLEEDDPVWRFSWVCSGDPLCQHP